MGLRTALGLKQRCQPKAPRPKDPQLEAWFNGKEFTTDWVTHNVDNWRTAFGQLQIDNPEILEIGSFEGRSAIVFLHLLPTSRLLSVDPQMHSARVQHNSSGSDRDGRLRRNLSEFGERVAFSTEFSIPALLRLMAERRFFDMIYVDGDHKREPTLADSLYAWTLLRTGGILIWDDYRWERDTLPPEKRPEQAIDWFLTAFDGQYALIHKGYQVIIQRTAPNAMMLTA